MPSTCFEPGSSPTRRWLYVHIWYNLFKCSSASSLGVQREGCLYCCMSTNYTIPVRTTIILKANPQVWNM